MGKSFKLLVENARQIVTVTKNGEKFLTGEKMSALNILQDKDKTYSILVDDNGMISKILPTNEMKAFIQDKEVKTRIDVKDKCIIPGLIDAHTHPVWAGDRVHEFAMKLAGATYMDIHKMGGGIHFTVKHTREASEEELYKTLTQRLTRMMHSGTTLVECKSGYGLDLENELKMLRVINRAKEDLPINVSVTYCGAHAVPRGNSTEETKDDVIQVQLPRIKSLISTGELVVDNIDVFCEKGVFDLDQSREILKKGQEIGLQLNFHGEELNRLHSAEMGAELAALAISHLEEVSDEGIASMARSTTAAVLLPTTAYNLRLPQPRARDMISAGVVVALGTDFNPNAHCLAMPLVMNLACVNMKMSMSEVLSAATINSAYALGQSMEQGSLEVGKQANMVVLDALSWEHLVYQMGSHHSLIRDVIIRGELVYSINTK